MCACIHSRDDAKSGIMGSGLVLLKAAVRFLIIGVL